MKTSFDLLKSLNENALPKIKKTRVLGESQENLKEYYKMKDDEHIVWDSEIDYYDENYMEEIKNNQYQDYLDDFTEDSEDKPLDFEQWYENYINDSSYDDWEILEDDLKENVFPQIDQQINHNCLILSGNYGSNYPDFRPSGAGGKLFTGTDDFRNYMAGFDRVCITTQNGILGAICNDHDGTVSGQFYTAPEDLTELAQLMGYKEEESEYGTIADDLDQDLANEYLEAQQLTQFMDKLVPIKDTITAYSVNESEELIEEEKVSDKLTEVKSQGNVYMLQDNDKYIVGEDYNKEENLIENAEIYENKEEADKDYFSRCDITRDGEQVDPTEQNLGVEEQPTEEA